MSLTFREQAAIALFALHEGGRPYFAEAGAAVAAQSLADAACEKWGHDENRVLVRLERGLPVHADGVVCRRCGVVLSHELPAVGVSEPSR